VFVFRLSFLALKRYPKNAWLEIPQGEVPRWWKVRLSAGFVRRGGDCHSRGPGLVGPKHQGAV